MTGRPNHPAAACAAALALFCLAPASRAFDAVVLEVRQVEVDGMVVKDASAQLDLLDEKNTRVTLKAGGMELPAPVGRLTQLQLLCPAEGAKALRICPHSPDWDRSRHK